MNNKWVILGLIALVSFSFVFALDPPTAEEKQYFKDSLKNYTEHEFSGKGVAISDDNTYSLSVYISKRQTLTVDEWSTVFRDAFETNPASWTEVYDFVLNRIEQSTYFEEYGSIWLNNQSYWMNEIQLDDSGLFARLNYTEGTIYISPLYWIVWTGDITIANTAYKTVVFKFGD